MRKQCAYLTMEKIEGWSIDAELGFAPMRALGWTVDTLPWRVDEVDWDEFDAVYIGTPWDYPDDPAQFMQVMRAVDRSSAVLVNDFALVAWSMQKTYLMDLEQRGAAIVPSRWAERLETGMFGEAFEHFQTDSIIVKPVIGTNAADTFPLDRDSLSQLAPKVCEKFADRPCMLQPFIENIRSEGEYSMFYFNRQFSHAIRKIPKKDDYRVQEEHGAEILAAHPEPALRDAADALLQLVEPQPVYARADFLRGPDGRFLLMELELIEPSMYLRMDPEAPRRFAQAFDEYVSRKLEIVRDE